MRLSECFDAQFSELFLYNPTKGLIKLHCDTGFDAQRFELFLYNLLCI